jgi:carbon monoxide dehydrogenase subunit G
LIVSVSATVDAAPGRVWGKLADLASHSEWMKDAESIVFTSGQTRGVGTTMDVKTRVGPLRTIDVVEVTDWIEGESIEIAHHGLVEGRGRLEVLPDQEASVVTWTEELLFPWWVGGGLTAMAARPLLTRIWLANLERLSARVSAL